MADPWDMGLTMSYDGFPSPEFESSWYNVTLLTASEPLMDMSQKIFSDGRMTPYFENLWNGVADDLGKDAIDIDVTMEVDGYATPEFEAFFEDLIT